MPPFLTFTKTKVKIKLASYFSLIPMAVVIYFNVLWQHSILHIWHKFSIYYVLVSSTLSVNESKKFVSGHHQLSLYCLIPWKMCLLAHLHNAAVLKKIRKTLKKCSFRTLFRPKHLTKYLMKTDAQLNPNISRTKNNKKIL